MAKKRVKRYVRGSEGGTPTTEQFRDMTKAYVPEPANIFESMVQKLMGVGTKKRGGSGAFGMGTKPKERLAAAHQHDLRVRSAKEYGREIDADTEHLHGSATTEPGYKAERRKQNRKARKIRAKRWEKFDETNRKARVKKVLKRVKSGKALSKRQEAELIKDINKKSGSSGVKVW